LSIWAGGRELLAPPNIAQALLAHQALDPAPGDDDSLAAQQPPDLAGSADPATQRAVSEHPLDVDDQLRVGRDRATYISHRAEQLPD
jgi:hypothetical protein